MHQIWFSSWADLGRIVLFTTCAYLVLLTLVRTTGKRVISKKNASDFILTVAVGSAAAAMALTKDVTLADGAVALATFILLQFLVVSLTTHWGLLRRLIEGDPVLLVFRGQLLRDALLHEEVNESEVFQAIRNDGIASLDRVYAVVLETDGSFSVIREGADAPTALGDVKRLDRGAPAHPFPSPGDERRSGGDRRRAS